MATPARKPAVKHNGITDTTLRDKTGKGWEEWFALLDKAGAKKMEHAAISRTLLSDHRLTEWHSQMIAVGYERARGIRERNQKCTGERSVSVSKTIAASLSDVFALCADDKGRAAWLQRRDACVRKANENKNVRLSWAGGSMVELRLTAKAADKTQVVADHGKLPDNTAVENMRAFWADALDRLKSAVEA